ncbi:MAG: DMT superfamily drug/metabolite permease [Candidatus Roizmanbacteria bacterium GW2011_GWC2_37_13]|uniref:DMT superfamily drug/metabolite permease n=1 Tax=Candidatus Roizmanbacteria bacterium GW2011_GWC2_37_13 TaxID=1618486 RepID=A0A0G0J8A8_9BACT|nr:MAG: DMT superfamily drug/metabolite permease [Candidatus Roizmanbacteria bacterium GW2011_GWC1_37_12]KKQ24311.1 MAG: DMT superfamily drug/metabolite permease [Candidatus Roizmanbacteria bacterium GW2011_GWC2_37_13]
MFFIILAALLWSFDGILRRGLYTLPPTVVVFWEHALGALVLFPFVFRSFKEVKKLALKEWVAILVVSLFSGALGTIFYTAALGKINYIQFSVVVLLQQLQPIWAIITAAIVLKEKVTKKFLPWAFLAIGASYLVTFKDLKLNWQTGQGTIIAAILALLAGMMWAASTSFSKIVLKKISFQMATFLRFIFAPVFALFFVFGLKQTNQLTKINPNQWTSLLIIVFSTGLVALLFYYFGLKKTQAKVSAILELTWPVSAIFIDYFYFKNGLSATQLIGAFLVLFSMYKVSKLKNG